MERSMHFSLLLVLSFNFFLLSVLGLSAPPVAIDVIQYDSGNYLMPIPSAAAMTAAHSARVQATYAHTTTASRIVSKGRLPSRIYGSKAQSFRTKPAAKTQIHAMAATASGATPATAGPVSYAARFLGLNQLNQEEAAYNTSGPLFQGNQTVQSPANVGLAVGGTYTVQVVSSAIKVSKIAGSAVTAATELAQFFNLQGGDIVLNARALYDSTTGRFYITASGINNVKASPFPSNFPDFASYQLIAVSKGSNPVAGFYYYVYDTTLPEGYHVDSYGQDLCPCYASSQSLGFSSDALLISAEALSLDSDVFVGTVIQAISKGAMTNGKATAGGVRFDGDTTQFLGYLTLGGAYVEDSYGDHYVVGEAYMVQPAHLPSVFKYGRDMPAAAYFLSTDVLSNGIASSVELWALTKLSSLGSKPTAVKLSQVTIPTDNYSNPPAGIQKIGLAPLANGAGMPVNEMAPLESIDTGDDRMHQVVYANGVLLGAFTTSTADASGIFYVVIKPSVDASGAVSGTLVASGTIAFPGVFLAYPAITANRKRALITYTASSTSMFPSVAYSYLELANYTVTGSGTAFSGKEPIDDYWGYLNAGYPVKQGVPYNDQPVGLFGQYSAAVVDGDSTFWVSAETTPGGDRDWHTNWGTVVAKLDAVEPEVTAAP